MNLPVQSVFWADGVLCIFPVYLNLNGSAVFTFPTFKHVLFLPGKPRSFLKATCQAEGFCDMVYLNYSKNIHVFQEKGRVLQKTDFDGLSFISCQ